MSPEQIEFLIGPASKAAAWLNTPGAEFMAVKCIARPLSASSRKIEHLYYKPRYIKSLKLWEWQQCESDGSDWKGKNEYVTR